MTRGADSSAVAVIAEDEDTGRLLLAESATAAGLEPVLFDNGADALKCILSRNASIVLLDVEMPGLDGLEVCRHVRNIPRLAATPVVMVTGKDDKVAINNAFKAGATDFISKPVSWALLPHRLRYIMRNAMAVRALADRESKLRTLLEAVPDSLWVVSPSGEPRWSPGAASASAPLASGEGTAPNFMESIPASHRIPTLTAIGETARDGKPRHINYREPAASGARKSAELRFSRVEGGDVLIVRQDTSERTVAAEHIERLAYIDGLTGLPNRQRLLETAEQFISCAEQSGEEMALLYLDLNSFKRINDAFGHSVGDTVLKRVAGMLADILSRFNPEDLSLARLGGDEFVIVVRDMAAREVAVDLADACCHALGNPIVIDQIEFMAAPSIGIAAYPADGRDVETLLKHADTAMYQAKSVGGPSTVVYAPAMSARLRDILSLEARLRRVVRAGSLDVRYQPKFRLHDQSIVGVEALSRWFDPELGEVAPNRFIKMAEESDLILDICGWLTESVCKQIREWLDVGIRLPVAINVSGKELLFGDPARLIESQAVKWRLPPSLIEVEITESVFVADSSAGRRNIEKLRSLGCRIALDDFGTGYSSLAYLTRFPPDRLKIDKSFVEHVDSSETDSAVVDAITSLARSLGLTVTAEGVERPAQLEWLKDRGCHEVQGFLLARPLTARDVEAQYEAKILPSLEQRLHCKSYK